MHEPVAPRHQLIPPQWDTPTPPPGFGPPVPPGGTGPSGGGGGRRRRNALLTVLAVLLAAGLGTGGWLIARDGSRTGSESGPAARDDSPLPEHRASAGIAWTKPARQAPEQAPAPGTWFTDEAVVKTQPDEVVAHDLATGKKRWGVPLQGRVCGTSVESAAGRAAVQHGDECRSLTVVDLEEGKRLWTRQLTDPDDPERFEAGEVAVTENTVGIASLSGWSVYRIDDRKRLHGSSPTSECGAKGMRGGEQLVVTGYCDNLGSSEVWVYDPKTGKPDWTWDVPGDLEALKIPSTSPLVVALGREETGEVEFLMHLEGEGRKPVRIDMKRQARYICSDQNALCPGIVVSDDAVYVQGESHSSAGDGGATVNSVLAHDLKTGAAVWVGEPEDKRELVLAGTVDGDFVGYEPPTGEKGGALLRYDRKTGKRTVYERHPAQTSEQEIGLAEDALPVLHRGMFFLAAQEVTSEAPEEETASPLVAAFR
ncbi:hypothetical protein DVA86_24940 [Streptomyces armeniacus]|uniref:Pyrrolo-quinoline quinone repeat domain-containing protein n=1 Tax=Streptomyces armeniacus TaxID=83291 RepID=A0A345XUU5_9ACTN|nr:PQQ-binding-like beta-propeller repeat protein [Streptomyces armeniacus]AXK35411.1 hypothetical protein DVA86_24940 [Streptomyces armeniacus]